MATHVLVVCTAAALACVEVGRRVEAQETVISALQCASDLVVCRQGQHEGGPGAKRLHAAICGRGPQSSRLSATLACDSRSSATAMAHEAINASLSAIMATQSAAGGTALEADAPAATKRQRLPASSAAGRGVRARDIPSAAGADAPPDSSPTEKLRTLALAAHRCGRLASWLGVRSAVVGDSTYGELTSAAQVSAALADKLTAVRLSTVASRQRRGGDGLSLIHI